MKIGNWLSAFAVLVASTTSVQAACGDHNTYNAASPNFQLSYTLEPSKITVASDFTMAIQVCKSDGTPFMGTLSVNAQMPMHRHGMNYTPKVTPNGPGKFHADGLLFHMPGQWQFQFDIHNNNKSERITSDYLLK